MSEIRIVQLETDPATGGVWSATLTVTFNGYKSSEATILLRPAQLLPRNDRALRDELRLLAEALVEAPMLPPKSPSAPQDRP
jgi:hypothetical protein